MKRRKFIQNLGLGVTPVFVQPLINDKLRRQDIPHYNYTQPATLKEAVTKEGQIIIRLEFQMEDRYEKQLKPGITVEKRNLLRIKSF